MLKEFYFVEIGKYEIKITINSLKTKIYVYFNEKYRI